VDDVLFMGDAADTKSDGTVIGSPWVFSDSQPQDRASLIALDQRLARDNVPVKIIAFAHPVCSRTGARRWTHSRPAASKPLSRSPH